MAINWTQVNVPTILAVAGAAWAIFQYFGDFDSRLMKMEDKDASRSVFTDQKFSDLGNSLAAVQLKLEQLNGIPYRVDVIERGLQDFARRMDRLSENMQGGIGEVRKDVNQIDKKLEVISSKIDDLVPQKRVETGTFSIPRAN